VSVRLRDGVEVALSDGTTIVCDASSPRGDVAVVSHAHGDHTPTEPTRAVCSPLTAALVEARQNISLERQDDDRVSLLPAGHVAGSRAALIVDPDGTRYLYTGDVCTRPRFYLEGFDPPAADVLIVEATYGEPAYVFPDHREVADDILQWLSDTTEPVLLFGYALGRAQKLQLLAETAGRERIVTTPAVQRVNAAITDYLDVSFDVNSYESVDELRSGDALVLPMTTGRIDWIDDLAAKSGALKAGFSGWAVDDSFKFRGDYDVTFPLSDHCDFSELVALVSAVEPETIYTQHGSADTLASELTHAGYSATALRANQTVLGDF
jgi:putative mRNA 3-end processing factor